MPGFQIRTPWPPIAPTHGGDISGWPSSAGRHYARRLRPSAVGVNGRVRRRVLGIRESKVQTETRTSRERSSGTFHSERKVSQHDADGGSGRGNVCEVNVVQSSTITAGSGGKLAFCSRYHDGQRPIPLSRIGREYDRNWTGLERRIQSV